MNDTNDSDTSDEEQIETPEQMVDPDNPWLAERKEFKDFMNGYNKFVQNNCKTEDENKNDKYKNSILNEESQGTNESEESDTNELKNDKIIKPIDNTKKTKNKVKKITVADLSTFDEEESFVEILKIVGSEKKKVHFASDTVESDTITNGIDTNIKINSTSVCNKKNKNIDTISTVSGIWYVSPPDDINVNKNKKKVHKNVESAFKTVETELKNKINDKLLKLKKVEAKESSKKDLIKRQYEEVKSDYLKINNKRTKAEFNEPLHEDIKTLDTNNKSYVENNQGPAIKIVEKPTKQVQNIDPTEFIKVTQTSLETEEMAQVEDKLDDTEENEQDKLIAEAFADDDIINEFK